MSLILKCIKTCKIFQVYEKKFDYIFISDYKFIGTFYKIYIYFGKIKKW